MKIDVYCPVCKTTTRVDFEPQQKKQEQKSDELFSIPSPDSVGGLTKMSIVHEDHILVLDIDMNGTVRRTDTINRITSKVQQCMATALSTLRNYTRIKDKLHIRILSDSEYWKKFLSYLSGQLIIDSSKHDASVKFFSTASGAELNYNNVIISLQNERTGDRGSRLIDGLILDDTVLNNRNLTDFVLSYTTNKSVIVINSTNNQSKDVTWERLNNILKNKKRSIMFFKITSVEEAALSFNQMLSDLLNKK